MVEFDLNKTYTNIITKKELIQRIKNCYDEKFIVVNLPRSKVNCDMLIRSLGEEFENE